MISDIISVKTTPEYYHDPVVSLRNFHQAMRTCFEARGGQQAVQDTLGRIESEDKNQEGHPALNKMINKLEMSLRPYSSTPEAGKKGSLLSMSIQQKFGISPQFN